MKKLLCMLMAAAACAACAPKEPPVSLIFDTDMAPDYDDVGALAVLHALADSGEARILATVSSNRLETTVPCIDVINTYFGREKIPLGGAQGRGRQSGYVAQGPAVDLRVGRPGFRIAREAPRRPRMRWRYTAVRWPASPIRAWSS